jgi:hypothetical protein
VSSRHVHLDAVGGWTDGDRKGEKELHVVDNESGRKEGEIDKRNY